MFDKIAGLWVRYEVEGVGEPVVLLHGWGASMESLHGLQHHLARYRRAYAVDLPGFGRTSFPHDPWSVGDYANWVAQFMDHMGFPKADFLGHSFGGRIAIKLAATAPARVNRLILVDSAGVRQFEVGWRLRAGLLLAKAAKPFKGLLPEWLYNRLRWRFYGMIGSTDYLTTGRLRQTYSRVISEDLEPLLPTICAPTLVLWGEKDQARPIEDARLMARKIPNAKLRILKKAGHYSFIDRPAEACAELDRFLLQVSETNSQ